MKDIFTFDNIKRFIINFVIAFGIVVVLEIIASIIGVPLGLLMVFVLIGAIYFGQRKLWF